MADAHPTPAAPVEAGPPEPSTSSVPSDQRKLASLGNLPPELKALIVEKVDEADRAEAEADWEDGDGDEDDDEDDHPDGVFTSSGLLGTSGSNPPPRGVKDDPWKDVKEPELGPDGNPTPEALARMRDSYLTDLSEALRPSGIEALTLVNREFSELALPIMWRSLDFENRSNESVLACIRTILPRHARHVRSLEFGQADGRMLRAEPYGTGYDAEDPFLPIPRQRLAIVDAAERYGGVSGDGLSSEVRHRRTRSLLMAEVVRQCSNVVRIDCEALPKTRLDWVDQIEEQDFGDRNIVYDTDHAVEAIKTHLGAKLVDLTFLANDDNVTTEADVAALVAACPRLLRLELECYVPSGPQANRDALYRALLQLVELESFTLHGCDFVTDDFAALDLPWPLKVLALGECENLSFPAFHTLVHRFGKTLECLDIDNTPHTNVDDDNEKWAARALDLPRLDTLVIATQHEAAFFLEAFAACPIATLGFGFCPAVSYRDLEAFVEQHVDTLRRVEIAHDAALTEPQVESFEVWCHAKGIECVLMPPGSDDEESDDEVMTDWDEDEDEDDVDEEDDDHAWSDEEDEDDMD
ncbi:uncharacterized protein JCM10292_003096 [Rhodotorula paludigena]|uniref:uncharacterized protein n=1 Tax=Rhodotorula paludigena TaxID=86838 RepID=UPI003174FE0A